MKLKEEKIEKASQGEKGGGERTGESIILRMKEGGVEEEKQACGRKQGESEREGWTETKRIN